MSWAVFKGVISPNMKLFMFNSNNMNSTTSPNRKIVETAMNRKKKIKQTIKKLVKKENAKKQPKNKERYISKAESAALEAEEQKKQEQETE